MLTVNNISNKLALDYSTFQRHKVAFYNFPLDRVLRICRFPQTFCSSRHLVIFFYLSHLQGQEEFLFKMLFTLEKKSNEQIELIDFLSFNTELS